ncbi:MBL fold metallo-hydrolase [Gorillibacterium timonense]|uniref:MBL fold metallo-hydrolase n=1 Tax=Gorillibacterium timonense TaxID=1689269 RepID=UPI00071DFF7F|nr:MBL fold metallo-hydrolase [Gorillibacterium timonense]
MLELEKNNYFTLQNVAAGIWAAIAEPGSGAAANSVILDLGDTTVIVDTFSLPQAADHLREAAERLTNRPAAFIVNTHFHGDHHYGNQSFPGSRIIASIRTKELLDQNPRGETADWQDGLRRQIDGLSEVRDAAFDPRVRLALDHEIGDKTNLFEAAPSIQRVGASLTLKDELWIHGSERSIRLFTYGGGHTESDLLVYVPDAKVLISGDLILGRSHPAMLHGEPKEWVSIIQRIDNELDIHKVIPGHGEVADRSCLRDMTSYLTDIQAYAEQAAKSSIDVEFWLAKGVPAPYDEWRLSHVFEWNFRWLFAKSQ